MKLKEGQVINDGENDLIVCSSMEYEGSEYIYVVNDKINEVGFYKVTDENDTYDFELVEDEKKIEELILIFAKDCAEKNPNALKEFEELMNKEKED